MTLSGYRLRPFAEGDYAEEARIVNRVHSGWTTSVEELQHFDALLASAGHVNEKRIVESTGRAGVVAVGELSTSPDSAEPRRLWTSVAVDPAHQHLGIGRWLADELEGAARARGVAALLASVEVEDARAVRFFGARGFRERRRVWLSRLDLTAERTPETASSSGRLVPKDVTITTLAEEGPERPEVLERLYRLKVATDADVPRIGRYTVISFDEFVQWDVRMPGAIPEAFFIARAGDEYVGLCVLETLSEAPDTLLQIYTGTSAAYRGRGIATAMKRRAIDYARTHGFRYIRTSNDSLNRAMWGINERLGFRRREVWVQGEKALVHGPA